MSVETDFRTLLSGFGPLTALVPPDRIAQDAVPEGTSGADGPLVVYGTAHDYQRGLDNSLHGDVCAITVVAWAADPASAADVADQVEAAVATVPDLAVVLGRSNTFEPELDLHGVQLAITWMP